jgi:poly(3-hydroxybutyrate) depolymerase
MQGGFAAPSVPPRPGDAAVRTIVFHGDADTTVNSRNGAEIVRQAAAREEAVHGRLRVTSVSGRSPDGRSHTMTVYRGAEPKPLVEYWLLAGAGHAWSGGSSRGSFADDAGPDASAEMVRFFSEP